jgi:excinuclease ABC subunit B
MRAAITETERRRRAQEEYNREHGITPASIVKQIDDVMSSVYERDYVTIPEDLGGYRTQAELDAEVERLQREMREAAANLDFERAAALRDQAKTLKRREMGLAPTGRR